MREEACWGGHTGIIPMGAGDYTAALCYELHQDLEEVFNRMSGMQQGAFDLSKSEQRIGHWEVQRFVEKVAMRLTGKKIKFIEEE